MNKTKRQSLIIAALVVLALVAIPMLAFAIPGSGTFVSTDSPSGRDITWLYDVLVYICWGILIIVEVILLVAIFKFRRKSDDERPKQVHGNLPIEIGWTLAAVVVQVYIGYITLGVMDQTEVIPDTEMTVEAIAYQWGWQFRYPDYGNMLTDDLVVPAHKNIKLEVTSRDVIHSIFIPELGVKIDAVPGRYNYWWFNADGPINQVTYEGAKKQRAKTTKRVTTRPEFVTDFYKWLGAEEFDYLTEGKHDVANDGLERRVKYLAQSREVGEVSPYAEYEAIEYRGMCTELCGKGHYDMYFRTVAMTDSSFEKWVNNQQNSSSTPDGAALYGSKCQTCHGPDGAGTPGTYPPLKGAKWAVDPEMKGDHIEVVLMGSGASSMAGTTTVLGVEYTGVMQAWNESFNDDEVAAIVNHERTSWGNAGGEVTGEDVALKREMLGLPAFPAGGATPTPEPELLTLGKKMYAACASCHGSDGVSTLGAPNLAKNPMVLADPKGTIGVITQGQDTDRWKGACPQMGETMNARQTASLLTYVRKSFGNEGSAVQPEEARRIRNEMK